MIFFFDKEKSIVHVKEVYVTRNMNGRIMIFAEVITTIFVVNSNSYTEPKPTRITTDKPLREHHKLGPVACRLRN